MAGRGVAGKHYDYPKVNNAESDIPSWAESPYRKRTLSAEPFKFTWHGAAKTVTTSQTGLRLSVN